MDISQKLKQLANNNCLPHAVLFEGNERKENSMFFARSVVCSGENKPCGKCSNCIKALSDNHPDILIYNTEGKAMIHSVETIRSIRRDVYVLPNEAKKKVIILKDVDNMEASSQNALLKILEEPPEFAAFVLTCNSKSKLLDTVISRVTVFASVHDDENAFSQQAIETATELVNTAILGSELDLLKKTTALNADKKSKFEALDATLFYLSTLLRVKSGVKADDNELVELCKKLTLTKIVGMRMAIEEAINLTKSNAHTNLNMTKLCADLRQSLGK